MKKQKRRGTYQLLSNNTARLQYMLKGERYSDTVPARTDIEAQEALANFVVSVQKGEFIKSNQTYLELAQIYMDDYIREECSANTETTYTNYLNNRILPYLGKYEINSITPKVLRSLFNEMKTWKTMYKSPRENKYISKETYRKLYNIIGGSLQKAVEWEILKYNPCRKIPLHNLHLEKLPSEIEKLKQKQAKTLKIRSYDIETYKQVIKLLNNDINNIGSFNDKNNVKKLAVKTSLETGFCIEELAGLKWNRDYCYNDSTLTINLVQVYIKKKGWIEKEPKASSRSRTLKIPTELNNILYQLQQQYPNEEYIFFGLINFNSFTSWLKNWQKKNNISPTLTAHELRHAHATVLLYLGVDIKTISVRMGHSSVRITYDTYIEYLPNNDNSAINLLEQIL